MILLRNRPAFNFNKLIMKTIHHIFRLFATAVVILGSKPSQSWSQDLQSAYFIDNYTYSYRLNPAFTTKKNFIGGLLSNVNFGSNSNVGMSTFFYPKEGKLATFLHPSVDRNEFLGKLKSTNRIGVNVSYNIASTGFWTKYKGKDIFQTFEINWRNNTSAKLPYNLFSFLKGGDIDDFSYDLSNVYGYTRTFMEFAGGTSAKFGKFTVGARAKLILGINRINLKIKEMFANLNGDEWSVYSYATITAAGGGIKDRRKKGAMSGEYYYEQLDLEGVKYRPIGFGGFGGAVDLGIRYEINDYINVSASLVDLGVIVWRNKVNGQNFGNTWIYDNTDIDSTIGNIGDALNDIIHKFRSMYEFLPEKKNFTTQSLSATFTVGAEFKMPFYNKMSVGIMGYSRNSNINRYNEIRASLNFAPLDWLSFSINTAKTTYGNSVGGMINVYAKKFNAFIGTDQYYYNMTPQLLPVYEANTNVVFGVGYLLGHNPYKKREIKKSRPVSY